MTKRKLAAFILALTCLAARSASAAEGDVATPDTTAKPAAPATAPTATAPTDTAPTATPPAIKSDTAPAITSTARHTATTAASGTAAPGSIKAQTQTPKKPEASPPASGVRAATPAGVKTGAPQALPAKQPLPAQPATTLPAKPAATLPANTSTTTLPPKPAAAPVPAAKPAAALPPKPAVTTAPAANAAMPPAAPAAPVATPADEATPSLLKQAADIEMFVREGCPHCNNAREFLDKLQALQPQLKINIRDVRKEPAALELLKRLAQNQEVGTLDYPAFVVSGQLIIGFSDEANTAQTILDNLPLLHGTGGDDEDCADSTTPGCGLIPAPPPSRPEHITLHLFGHSIQLSHIGMPLFTIVAGLLDGLNFGSTWVLVLMLSLLAPLKDRARMLSITGTFLLVQAVFFFLVMVVWYNLVGTISTIRAVQMVFAIIAVIAAAAYFWKFLIYGQRLSIATPEIDKPGIYTYIRKIIETETFVATLLGAMALSVFVLLTEFSFKSVFPLLYTKVLAMQNFGTFASYGYLALYDLAYMLDDFIILAIGIATLKQERTMERKDNKLNLLSALLLLATAVYLFLIRLH